MEKQSVLSIADIQNGAGLIFACEQGRMLSEFHRPRIVPHFSARALCGSTVYRVLILQSY